MPDLSEDVIRQITERVTREVLAALHETDDGPQVADVWPDWDELNLEPSPIPRHEAQDVVGAVPTSPLRARLVNGQIDSEVVDDDEPDGPEGVESAGGFGGVIPMGATATVTHASGFRPDESWIDAQWKREPGIVRNPPGLPAWALERVAEIG